MLDVKQSLLIIIYTVYTDVFKSPCLDITILGIGQDTDGFTYESIGLVAFRMCSMLLVCVSRSIASFHQEYYLLLFASIPAIQDLFFIQKQCDKQGEKSLSIYSVH